MTEEFTTPPGRLVWGHPLKLRVKKNKKRETIMKDGVPVEECAFGVAFPKNDFNTHIWPYMQKEASTMFPSGVPGNFSWKIVDGDGVDKKGQPYSQREGYAGCWVVTFKSTGFTSKVAKHENGGFRFIEPNEIKTGDYVRVGASVKAHNEETPGIYVNPQGVELIGYGGEIVGSDSNPDELFGDRSFQLPAGASAAPTGGTGGIPGQPAPAGAGYPPQAAQAAPMAAPAPAAATPGYPPQPAPANLPPPAHDFVQNAGQPVPAAAQAPAPAGYPPQPAPQPAPAAAPAGYPPGMAAQAGR